MNLPEGSVGSANRRWAVLATLSLLAVGFVNVVQLLVRGVEPLWGLVVALPVVFFVVLGWIAFRNDAAREGG